MCIRDRAEEQGGLNRQSQLIGAGVSLLGTLGSSFIESGGLQPRNTTNSTTMTSNLEFAPGSGPNTNLMIGGFNPSYTSPASG